MLRLGWCSPFPPDRSGIADYSTELISAIDSAQLAEVTLFCNDRDEFDVPALTHLKRYAINDLDKHRFEFDLPIYQMGNHVLHRHIYAQALRHPGILVLHEYILWDLAQAIIVDPAGDRNRFRELIYETRTSEISRLPDRFFPNLYNLPNDFSYNRRLVDSSLGIVTHSRYVKDKIYENHSSVPRHKILHQHGQPKIMPFIPTDPVRPIVFGCAGQITPAKRIDCVLDAFKQLLDRGENVKLLLIGKAVPEVPLTDWIADRQLSEHVTYTGYIATTTAFVNQLAQADVIINLRQPTVGETSAAVIRSMAIGRPVIVYDHGWYAELPDCCIKIEPGSTLALATAMQQLVSNPNQIKQLGLLCQAEIEAHHRPEQVAGEFISWLETFGV